MKIDGEISFKYLTCVNNVGTYWVNRSVEQHLASGHEIVVGHEIAGSSSCLAHAVNSFSSQEATNDYTTWQIAIIK